MATVTFDHATRIYPGTERPAVDGLDLHIEDGEFLVLVGPSGCGKSTSLRMLAGLEDVNAGRVLIGDRDVTDVQPKDRDIAMVFQNYALYPHMTVAENMGFALKIAGVGKEERAQRVLEAAKLLDVAPATSEAEMCAQAKALMTFGCGAVLLKGGHAAGADALDVLFDGAAHHVLRRPWVATRNTHGTGCTLSAAIAANLALGLPLRHAVTAAKDFVWDALRAGAGRSVGLGAGPLDHHFASRKPRTP